MQTSGSPEKVTTAKSGSNKAETDQINETMEVPMIICQVTDLNNIVEQGHRAVRRITKRMHRFKPFQATKSVLAGIELMYMICEGQPHCAGSEQMSMAEHFYALAGKNRLM
jgi:putative transposase